MRGTPLAARIEPLYGDASHLTSNPGQPGTGERQSQARSERARTCGTDGTIKDPTGGATHFYTPQAMPKEGDETKGRDVAGGLESVPGVVDDDGNAVRNYRPGWVAGMTQQTVPCVSESVFKFYRQAGTGHVR